MNQFNNNMNNTTSWEQKRQRKKQLKIINSSNKLRSYFNIIKQRGIGNENVKLEGL